MPDFFFVHGTHMSASAMLANRAWQRSPLVLAEPLGDCQFSFLQCSTCCQAPAGAPPLFWMHDRVDLASQMTPDYFEGQQHTMQKEHPRKFDVTSRDVACPGGLL
eukprot:jgi/Ulvmu1/7003/UM033_0061.1